MNWPFWNSTRSAAADDCAAIDALLSLYADGMASPAEARAVESHLPACADCRESLAWMQATQRALAARPVVTPPADLRARIAGAIAASSGAPGLVPVTLRPARTFRLRPAYAAAASLTVLGFVGYSLLHAAHPGPAQPSVATRPAPTPPEVASVPPAAPPLTKPGSSHAPVKLPDTVHPVRPARSATPDLSRVASRTETADEATPTQAPPAVKVLSQPLPPTAFGKPRPTLTKKPVRAQTKPLLLAVNKSAAPAPLKPLAATPEMKNPTIVAARLPQTAPPSVPVDIAPTIIHQDPAPTVAVATAQDIRPHTADLLGPVREHLGQMRTATFKAIVRQSGAGATLATRTFSDQERTPGVNMVHSPTNY